jgi:hypothetical protein
LRKGLTECQRFRIECQRLSTHAWGAAAGKNGSLAAQGRETAVRDLIFVVIIVVFFVLCTLYVRALDRS